MKKIISSLIIFMIFAFTAFFMFSPPKEKSQMENRSLSGQPQFSFDALIKGRFTKDFETFLSDQFPMREGFLKAYIKLNTQKSSIPNANYNEMIEGTEGYNFYIYDENLIVKLFSEKKNEDVGYMWADIINDTADFCKQKDLEFLVNFAPSKAEALNSMLPDFLSNNSDKPIKDLIMRQADDSVIFIDTMHEFEKQPLSELKKRYYNTDHHWNAYGAHCAYEILAENISSKLGLKGNISDFDFESVPLEQDYFIGSYNRNLGDAYPKNEKLEYIEPKDKSLFDNLKIKTLNGDADYSAVIGTIKTGNWVSYNTLFTEDYPLLELHNDNALNKYKILVFKDSYFNALIPNISLLFSDVYVVDTRHYENFVLSDFVKANDIKGIMFFFNSTAFIKTDELPKFTINK